jgi:hypothetical protein
MYQEAKILFALEESTRITIPSIKPDKESPANTPGDISMFILINNGNKQIFLTHMPPNPALGHSPRGFLQG